MSVLVDGHWLPVTDKDRRALAIYLRHYSARKNRILPRQQAARLAGRNGGFVGTSDFLCLMTVDCTALFVWKRYPDGVGRDGQRGVVCSVFRNESPVLSSDLIREADALADARWPGERHFTYVDPSKIRSTNPGFSFQCAGWVRCGTNKDGRLVVLERLPVPPQEESA